MTAENRRDERLLDRYLNELSWAMGGSFAEQQTARDELRSHILDAAREHELAGMAPEASLRAALGDFGEPAGGGQRMRASRGTAPLSRPLAQPEGALILEARRVRHLPPLPLLLALAALAISSVGLAVAYAWP